MKRAGLLMLCGLLCGTLCGCDRMIIGRNELNMLIFPAVVAVDEAADSAVVLTVMSKQTEDKKKAGSDSSNGGSAKTGLLRAEGKTVFEANKKFTTFSNKDINWGQNEYILLGEPLARNNLLSYLDFFIRNHENRLTVSVALVAGPEAGELLRESAKGDEMVSESLLNLFDDSGAMSLSRQIKLSELLEDLNNPYAGAVLPVISARQEGDSSKESEGSAMRLQGFGVIKDGALLGFLDEGQSLGLNWLGNHIRATSLLAKDPDGDEVSMEVVRSSVKIKAKLDADTPVFDVDIRMWGNIEEFSGQGDFFTREALSSFEEQMENQVRQDVESAIAYALVNNVDILGFGDALHRKHPVKWNHVKDNWSEMFPRARVMVRVQARVVRTYNIKEPLGSKGEKK